MRVFVAGGSGVVSRRLISQLLERGRDQAVVMMTAGRGCANAKAKRELGWLPAYTSWRTESDKELR